jgi:hypothetical protein
MTSIQFLFNELWESPKDKLTWHTILNKAKEMHKQEIIEAYCNGNDLIGAEQYYQETCPEQFQEIYDRGLLIEEPKKD